MENVHVARWGSQGPRAILIHGGAQGTSSAGHRNFREQERLGGEGWQLLVPDRPGHGDSPHPGRPDSAEEDGAWAAELLGDGAHLLGHSFGGLVALNAASRRPEAVKSLTLVEPALHKIATRAPAVRKLLLRMAATMILPSSNATKALKVMKLLGIPGEFARNREDLASLGEALKRVKFPAKAELRRQLAGIAERNIPFLVISGGWSPAFVATGELAAELGGGTHVVVPWENHFPQWSGAKFNQVLGDFWQRAKIGSARN